MRERLRIFGAGVRASIVVDLIAWQFADLFQVQGYYDDRLPGGTHGPAGYPVLGTLADGVREMPGADCKAFVALGTRASAKGCQIFMTLQSRGVSASSFISLTAHVSPSAEIGQNALVLPGVFIGHQAKIGNMFCAHGGSVVEHHSHIGHNVLLGPGVAIASSVYIGSHSFLGTGVKVIPEMSVGCGSWLGAGSIVIRDIPAHVVAFGQPATPQRTVKLGDEVPIQEDILKLAQLGFD